VVQQRSPDFWLKDFIMMKTNTQLQNEVMEELKWEPCVTATEVRVLANNGLVTLSGTVPTFAEKFAAERAARRVEGVNELTDEIRVTPLGNYKRTDQEIAAAAGQALKFHVWVPANVQASVEKSLVTLRGEVNWQYQRNAAVEAVRYLAGVTGIANLISIKPTGTPTDVQKAIERAFDRNGEIDAEHIKVCTEGGKVTLSGHVRSRSGRQEAAEAAWSAPGVNAVQNDITASA
jgi:osmotically-inducible protein OsmY